MDELNNFANQIEKYLLLIGIDNIQERKFFGCRIPYYLLYQNKNYGIEVAVLEGIHYFAVKRYNPHYTRDDYYEIVDPDYWDNVCDDWFTLTIKSKDIPKEEFLRCCISTFKNVYNLR